MKGERRGKRGIPLIRPRFRAATFSHKGRREVLGAGLAATYWRTQLAQEVMQCASLLPFVGEGGRAKARSDEG